MKVIDADVHFGESHLPNAKSQFVCHRMSLFVGLAVHWTRPAVTTSLQPVTR